MIKVKLDKNNKDINSITIEGHSGYSEFGSDIVCASVSSIAITSINGILKIDEGSLKYETKDGFIKIDVLKHTKVIDLLLENMIEHLESVSNQYDKYVKII